MGYYAAPEGGDDVAQPGHNALIDLIDALDTAANTFFVVYPADDDLESSIAVSKHISAFGGFEIDRTDPATGEHTVTTAAAPNTIADDILAWITTR